MHWLSGGIFRVNPNHWQLSAFFSGAIQGVFQGLQRQSGYLFRDNLGRWKLSAFSIGACQGVVGDCNCCQGASSGTTPTTGSSRHFHWRVSGCLPEIAAAVRIPVQGQPRPLETLGVFCWGVSKVWAEIALAVMGLLQGQPQPLATLGIFLWRIQGISRDCRGSQDTSSGTTSTTGNSRRCLLVRVKGLSEIAIAVREPLQGQPLPWHLPTQRGSGRTAFNSWGLA